MVKIFIWYVIFSFVVVVKRRRWTRNAFWRSTKVKRVNDEQHFEKCVLIKIGLVKREKRMERETERERKNQHPKQICAQSDYTMCRRHSEKKTTSGKNYTQLTKKSKQITRNNSFWPLPQSFINTQTLYSTLMDTQIYKNERMNHMLWDRIQSHFQHLSVTSCCSHTTDFLCLIYFFNGRRHRHSLAFLTFFFLDYDLIY